MKCLIYFLIVALAVLHHDFWWWDDSETLVFGIFPIALAYHAGISVTAGILWALAVRYCWPEGVDDVEEEAGTMAGGEA
jgi:hypothetical protein